jgi:hypothetical protein
MFWLKNVDVTIILDLLLFTIDAKCIAFNLLSSMNFHDHSVL